MRIIVSKKAKDKDFTDKKKFKLYWKKVHPSDYVDLMTGATKVPAALKLAKQNKEQVICKGKLRQTSDGYVYVNVPNDLVDGLYKLINDSDPRIQRPPYGQKKYNNIGAHISAIKGDEVEENELEIKEIGEEIEYTTGELYTVNPEGWDDMQRVWFVNVESTELEKIRDRYGLSKKIDGHEFHITVGVLKADGK